MHPWQLSSDVLSAAGDDLVSIGENLKPGATRYTARDVIERMLDPRPAGLGTQP